MWRRTSRCFEMRRSCCVSTRRWHAASETARTSTCTDADVRAATGRLMAAHHNTAHVRTQMTCQAIRAGSLSCMSSRVFQTDLQCDFIVLLESSSDNGNLSSGVHEVSK